MKLTHGGDWAGFMAQYGRMPLDFSANISPLGLPDGVRRAACASLSSADCYPDPLCRALSSALGARHKLPVDAVLCGNGAADLIFRLVLAVRPKRALVTAPAFAEYEQALGLSDCRTEHFYLREENGFVAAEEILEAITPALDVVFLCEPNNPTGRTTPPALLLRILERCTACGVLLVVDECFNDFLDEPQAHTPEPQRGAEAAGKLEVG